MMWKSIFNFAIIILILLFFTACQYPVKFSKDYSGKSAINSQERSHKKQTLHENTIKEKWISQKQKEHKFRESLQSYIGLKHPPLPDDLKRRGSLLVGTGDASEYPYVVNLIEIRKALNLQNVLNYLISKMKLLYFIFKCFISKLLYNIIQ